MNFNWVAKNYQICFMTIKCYLKSYHVSFLIVFSSLDRLCSIQSECTDIICSYTWCSTKNIKRFHESI